MGEDIPPAPSPREEMMEPDLMRAIDRYAGIPLTFLVTQVWRLGQLLFGRSRPVRPRKILFIELSEMGSTILADPAMRKARDHFQAELYFLIFKKNRASLNLLQTIPAENVFVLDASDLRNLAADVRKFREWCRVQRFDTVVDLELFSRFTALLSWLTGAVNKVGFYAFYDEGLYRGNFLSHKVAYNPHLHIAKNFIALINALIAPREEIPYSKVAVADAELLLPLVSSSALELAAMRAKVKDAYPGYEAEGHRLLLVNPNSSQLLPQRRWPAENYISLIRRVLATYPETVVLLTGAAEEMAGAETIVRAVGAGRCVNFTGRLRLEELPVLYNLAALMVTNDSGPGHFSAITKMPTIVLFGPETPKLYGSLGRATFVYAGLACSPCVSATNHRKTACRDNVCLQAITAEEVFAAVAGYLG